MYVVAIAALGSSDPEKLGLLAAELGTTLYELRLVLKAGLPAVVVLTVDISVAANAARAIERYGHRAVSGDRGRLASSQTMINVVDVAFDPSVLRAGNAQDDRLAYGDIVALLRATQRSEQTQVREEKERKFRPGMALATGGLVLSKTTKRQVVTHTDTRQQVLYVFDGRGSTPWILREHGVRYTGLGAELAPTSLANFETTLRKLRERAPGAVYDARLMSARTVRGIADGAAATDLLAHLIALDLRAATR
jgi:hypothetical protein